jgi:hypothetical protein
MIDRIWASWQARHGGAGYLPSSGYEHNNVADLMHPYEESGIRVTPADVADIGRLGYRYDSAVPLGAPRTSRALYCPLTRLGRS